MRLAFADGPVDDGAVVDDDEPPRHWSDETIRACTRLQIVRAFRAVRPAVRVCLEPAGISPPQFGVLLLLDNLSGPTRAELARRAMTSPQSMGQLVESLARAGYVERTDSVGRGNAQAVRLTDRGRELLDEMTPLILRTEEPEALGLTREENHRLLTLLGKVIDHPH